jgi:uncharacterized damage-inducible protein DinB
MEQTILAYANGASLLKAAIEGLTEEQLNKREKENGWSIKEVVIHLCDAEIVLTHRVKQVISEENPLMIGFDQDLWAARQNYANLDLAVYLEIYRLLRESLVPIFYNLQATDWSRTGLHNQAGTLTLSDLAVKLVSHTATHLKQIQRIKDANAI